MKVISPGRPQKGWARRYTCTGRDNGGGGCGALLLVEQADVFKRTKSCYDGETDTFYSFRCPECGVITDIPAEQVPFDPPPYSRWPADHRPPAGA